MGWASPPDRRELSLLLFCLAVYAFAYNLEASLELLGSPSVGRALSRIGLGKANSIASDGRKPHPYQDNLELDIYGNWQWDEGEIADNAADRNQKPGAGLHHAMWVDPKEMAQITSQLPVGQALQWWRDDVPKTRALKHVPGYTVLDNVFIFNGSVYLVTDDKEELPPIENIVSSVGPRFGPWQILGSKEAVNKFGGYGGAIRGVSWLSADITPHNSTLLALWRTYSTLDPSITQTGQTTLPLPERLIFPNLPVFADVDPPNPPMKDNLVPRRRTDTGFHPYLLKVGFPRMGVMYDEDWNDWMGMEVPWVFERLVVGDRNATTTSMEVASASTPMGGFEQGLKSLMDMEGPEFWWEPIKKNLIEFLDLELSKGQGKKKVVTYVVAQSKNEGGMGSGKKLKLREEDHVKLVSALKKMERSLGCEVQVVYEDLKKTSWLERMEAIVRSSVVLGVNGGHMMDSVFMKRSNQATVMEFYSEKKSLMHKTLAVVVPKVGLKYVAWVGGKEYSGKELSKISGSRIGSGDGGAYGSDGEVEEVRIDVEKVVKSVRSVVLKA